VLRLFIFEKEQKVFDINGTMIGGQPGRYPTVMIGSMFFQGDKIVTDEKNGRFNKSEAETIINEVEEASEKTGNPYLIDVVGAWPEALVKYIDFIAEATTVPFLIDGTTSDVRIAGAKYVKEVGLTERSIYNTIMPEDKKEEITALKESGIKTAVLLAFNPKMPTLKGRMDVLSELLKAAEAGGIANTLIDTAILDVPDPGPASKAIYKVKELYGIPAGCGAHNAIDRWHERKKLERTRYSISSAVAFTSTIMMGADFLLYGPLKKAAEIFPTIGLADAYVAYSMMQEYGIRPAVNNHPLRKIFI